MATKVATPDPGPRKVFVFTINGQRIRMDALPVGVLEKIEEESGERWGWIIDAPVSTAKLANTIVRHVAAHLDIEPPAWTARELLDAFVLVDDDVPADGENPLAPTT